MDTFIKVNKNIFLMEKNASYLSHNIQKTFKESESFFLEELRNFQYHKEIKKII